MQPENDFVQLAQSLGFDLAKYDDFKEMEPWEIGYNLHVRGWYLEINATYLDMNTTGRNDIEGPDFDEIGANFQKAYIANLIENPVRTDILQRKQSIAVLDLNPEIETVMPTEHGIEYKGTFSKLLKDDPFFHDRMVLGINKNASFDAICDQVKEALEDHKKEQFKRFPKFKGPRTQTDVTKEILEKKVLPALDLMILQEHFELFEYGDASGQPLRFPYNDKRATLMRMVFPDSLGGWFPSRPHDWEKFAWQCTLPEFTRWLRS